MKSVSMKSKMHEWLQKGEELSNAEYVCDCELRDIERWLTYFQHERLVHLIIMVLFAMMSILSLLMVLLFASIGTLLLFLLMLCLTIPYIKHYYLLENGIQNLYVFIDRIYAKRDGTKK